MKKILLICCVCIFLCSCISKKCNCLVAAMDERPYYKVIKIKEKEEWPFLVIYATSPIEGEEDTVHVILSLKPEKLSKFS